MLEKDLDMCCIATSSVDIMATANEENLYIHDDKQYNIQ